MFDRRPRRSQQRLLHRAREIGFSLFGQDRHSNCDTGHSPGDMKNVEGEGGGGESNSQAAVYILLVCCFDLYMGLATHCCPMYDVLAGMSGSPLSPGGTNRGALLFKNMPA